MSRYLDMVEQPTQVRKFTIDQLHTLAKEIREEMITILAKNGGHSGRTLAWSS